MANAGERDVIRDPQIRELVEKLDVYPQRIERILAIMGERLVQGKEISDLLEILEEISVEQEGVGEVARAKAREAYLEARRKL